MKQFLQFILFTITAACGLAEPAPAPAAPPDSFAAEMLKLQTAIRKTKVCVWNEAGANSAQYTLPKGDEFLRQLADPASSARILRSLTGIMHQRNSTPLKKLAQAFSEAEASVAALKEPTTHSKKCVMFALTPAKKMFADMAANPASSNQEWAKIAKVTLEYLDALQTVK